ncbi:MAG: glycosyltransferase family 4 protein [Candidatus Omnitrophica bacterium]|nr:glycosyltransferase family 4 protein [Candidatus Omnitrophota bacterium]
MQVKNKKILIICSLPPPFHGMTIFNYNLLNSKIKNLFKIIHLDTSDRRNFDNLGKLDFINVYLGLKNIFQLIFLLLKERPEIVYLNIAQNKAYLRDGLFIIITKLFSKSKIVVHNHGIFKDFYDSTNLFMRSFIDFTLRGVDTFIVLGNCLKYTVQKWSKYTEVVPNGVDFNCSINSKFKPKKTLTVSYMGMFFKKKGIIDLLEAAKIVCDKILDVRFKFAGLWWRQEEDVKDYALRFIQNNNLSDKIEFLGFLLGKEKEKFLLDTDIFVLPTYYDAFGIVLIEAMAAGCPVISTRVGAIPEIVIEGETGILVKKHNPKALADAIIYLIENPDIREKMGRAGRKRYEECYTLDKNIEGMIRVFNKVLLNDKKRG